MSHKSKSKSFSWMHWLIGRWSWVSDASGSLQGGRRLQTTCHRARVRVAAVSRDQLSTHKENTESEGHEDKTALRSTMREGSAPCRSAAVFTLHPQGRVGGTSPFHFTVWEPVSLSQSVVTHWRRTAVCKGGGGFKRSWRKACVKTWLSVCFHGVGKTGHPTDCDCVCRRHSTTDTFQQMTRLHLHIFLFCPALPFISTVVWLPNYHHMHILMENTPQILKFLHAGIWLLLN